MTCAVVTFSLEAEDIAAVDGDRYRLTGVPPHPTALRSATFSPWGEGVDLAEPTYSPKSFLGFSMTLRQLGQHPGYRTVAIWRLPFAIGAVVVGVLGR